MQTITTTTGKVFQVGWCGLSTIDYVLRFGVRGESMANVLQVFTDPAETAMLSHTFDEHTNEYDGFTTFIGVDLKPNGEIVVSLSE